MPVLLYILSLINSTKQMQSGDKLGAVMSALGSSYNFFNNSTPKYDNTMSDSGVRRNYL